MSGSFYLTTRWIWSVWRLSYHGSLPCLNFTHTSRQLSSESHFFPSPLECFQPTKNPPISTTYFTFSFAWIVRRNYPLYSYWESGSHLHKKTQLLGSAAKSTCQCEDLRLSSNAHIKRWVLLCTPVTPALSMRITGVPWSARLTAKERAPSSVKDLVSRRQSMLRTHACTHHTKESSVAISWCAQAILRPFYSKFAS